MGTVFSDEGDDDTRPVTRPNSALPPTGQQMTVGEHVVHKPPGLVRLERDKNIEVRPMLQVPHTEVRLLYVERERRSDVVGPHGYLAIALDKKVQEQQLREAAEANEMPIKRPRNDSNEDSNRTSTEQRAGGGGGQPARGTEYSVSATLHDIMSDPNPVAAAALEYNEDEHLDLQTFIKEWKTAFKQQYQRFPTRKDISRDPEILAKHERSRDLEAMRKLLDEQELANMKRGIDDLIELEGVERKNKAKLQQQREDEEKAAEEAEEAEFAKLPKHEESAAMDLDNFEYALLRDMIKQWKRSFKDENGRKPTKKDLQADPQMSDAYEKVQSFEAFQRSQPSFTAGSPMKKSASSLGESGVEIAALRQDSIAEEDALAGGTRKRSVSLTSPDDALDDRRLSNGGKPVRGWVPTSFSPSPGEQAENEAYPFSQKFVFPKGRSMQDRVFFTVDENCDIGHSVMSLSHKNYDLEEDEIFEMAGVHRPALPPKDVKQKDPLSSYELQSNLLDALRIAIEAPIESFRDGTADSALEEFRQQALSEAQYLFDNARHEDAAFAATAGSATANQTLLLRMGTKLKSTLLQQGNGPASRLGSAASSRQFGGSARKGGGWNDLASNRSVSPAVSLGDGVATGTVESQIFERLDGHTTGSGIHQAEDDDGGPPIESVRRVSDSLPGPRRVSDSLPGPRRASEDLVEEDKPTMVRERKRLHRILNEYKEQYLQANGIAPDGFTMAQDPQIRDVFAAYTELKRLTKKKKGEAGDDDAAPAGATEGGAGPGGDISAAEEYSPQFVEPLPPPAPYVPHRDIVTIIQNASPQRPQLTTLTAELSPEEIELKQLQKEVKVWKRGFKEREGRNPTRRDLRENPDICDKYNRLKELEGGGNDDDGAAAQRSAMFAEMSAEQISEHFSSALMQEEQTEEVDRRDIEADETIAFRQICNAAGKNRKQSFVHGGGDRSGDSLLIAKKLSTYSSMRNSQRTNSSAGDGNVQATDGDGAAPEGPSAHVPETLVIEDEEGEAPRSALIPPPAPKRVSDNGWNSPGADDDDDAGTGANRRKSLAKELNEWKKSFHDLHGRQPTTHDMKEDQHAMSKYQEYEALPREGAESALSYERQQAALVVTEQALGRQLQEWRLEFAKFHGREATMKDLGEDAGMLALYERYLAARESQEPDPSDYIGLSLKRKQLGKALNEWKRDFAMRVGRNPTAKDIKNDTTMSVMFDRYQSIPKDVDELALQQLNNAAHWEASAEDTEQQRRKELKRRKKDLSRLLNEWKHEFELVNGRKPKVADIMADAMVQTVYTEFQALEKELAQGGDPDGTTLSVGNSRSGSAAGAGRAKSWMDAAEGDQSDHQQQDEREQERAETPLPKRKKRLAKQLNAWKAAFKEREGRNPSKSDIQNAPEVAEIYKQYQELRKQLKASGEGGGGDDDDEQQQERGDANTSEAKQAVDTTANSVTPEASPQRRDADQSAELSPAAHDNDPEMEAIEPLSPEALAIFSPADLKNRKKLISKTLNRWKEQFANEHGGKAPKTSDIRKDPQALPLFEELQAIKGLLLNNSEVAGAAGNGGVVEEDLA